jgi:hypothetical protein
MGLFDSHSVADPGCFIPDPDPTIAPSRIRILDTGGKKAPDPGSDLLLYKGYYQILFAYPVSGSDHCSISDPGSRIQGVKKHQIPDPDPQHWTVICSPSSTSVYDNVTCIIESCSHVCTGTGM